MIGASLIAVPAGAAGVGGDGVKVGEPGGGVDVVAWTLEKGRIAAMVPSIEVARKWRRPIGGRRPGLIFLLSVGARDLGTQPLRMQVRYEQQAARPRLCPCRFESVNNELD